jgi:guanylate kinase
MADLHHELLDAARLYELPQPAIELLSQHQPLIISAITAGGKTTIAERIIEKSDYRLVVTHTTRPIKPDEVNGVNYWFVNESEMLELIKSGAFIEVQPIHGEFVYGTSIGAYKTVLQGGHQPLLVIDVQGIKEIITSMPAIKPVFILPPNYEAWIDRLHSRGAMSHVERTRRLQSAKAEIDTVLADPHFVMIINNDVERTADEILQGPTIVNQHKSREIAQQLIDNIKT